MATCAGCGAPVVFKEVDGQRAPFDVHETMAGESRYAERPDGLVPVAPQQNVMAWQLHAATCIAK